MKITIEIAGVDVDVVVDYTGTPSIPAQLDGHPDNRMPEEGGDLEITELTMNGKDAKVLLTDPRVYGNIVETIEEEMKTEKEY